MQALRASGLRSGVRPSVILPGVVLVPNGRGAAGGRRSAGGSRSGPREGGAFGGRGRSLDAGGVCAAAPGSAAGPAPAGVTARSPGAGADLATPTRAPGLAPRPRPQASRRSAVVVRAADRPTWYPGATPPAHLDGTLGAAPAARRAPRHGSVARWAEWAEARRHGGSRTAAALSPTALSPTPLRRGRPAPWGRRCSTTARSRPRRPLETPPAGDRGFDPLRLVRPPGGGLALLRRGCCGRAPSARSRARPAPAPLPSLVGPSKAPSHLASLPRTAPTDRADANRPDKIQPSPGHRPREPQVVCRGRADQRPLGDGRRRGHPVHRPRGAAQVLARGRRGARRGRRAARALDLTGWDRIGRADQIWPG
jgi:hypothetical protein